MMEAARDVKIGQGANCIEAAAARIRGFLGDKYHMYRSEPSISQLNQINILGIFCYRFVGTACFIAGNATEYLGYKWGADYPTHLREDHAANHSVIDDDEANYVEFHPVKIGVCLQGVAIVILMSHLLTYLCLVSEIGEYTG